ncbi:MAG: DUF4253 domain-containing protein [Rhodoglobus sp.]
MTSWQRFLDSRRRETRNGKEGSIGGLATPDPADGRAGGSVGERVRSESAGLTVLADSGVELAGLVCLGVTPSGLEIVGLPAPAGDLVPLWHRVRALHERSGLWPVLFGPDVGDMCMTLLDAKDDYDDVDVLASVVAMTDSDLAELRARRRAGSGTDSEAPQFAELPSQMRAAPAHFQVADQDGHVALVPALAGWAVPAILGWSGGVNHEIEPAEHAATLRDWSDRFGAELVSLTGGDQVLELLVAKPPHGPEEALSVAWEQYVYCPDAVDQGVGSVTSLAATQVVSHSWYFWWD